jgi:N-acetylglucosaminyldiphosphoundecaprenol N-acetyl-beta-D-mannosaminyltransferase
LRKQAVKVHDSASELGFGIANPDSGETPESRRLLGMRVDHTTYEHATGLIVQWARRRESRYVCASSVNNIIEAYDSPVFRAAMNGADLVTPDGMPLVWGLRALGCRNATRVYGPNLMKQVCRAAADEGLAVGFYGGDPKVLSALTKVAAQLWPGLKIEYSWSPPFRALKPTEDQQVIADMNSTDARIIFVGLGTPKQDLWMARHKSQLNAVTVGVGAAFDFIVGEKRQAPPLMQRAGLEWLFRLCTEPRRLWRRYLYRNPRFVALFTLQLLKELQVNRSGRLARIRRRTR